MQLTEILVAKMLDRKKVLVLEPTVKLAAEAHKSLEEEARRHGEFQVYRSAGNWSIQTLVSYRQPGRILVRTWSSHAQLWGMRADVVVVDQHGFKPPVDSMVMAGMAAGKDGELIFA